MTKKNVEETKLTNAMVPMHLFMQGKGGVGKSTLAQFFIQYLQEKEIAYIAYDVDPINSTLLQYKGTKARKWDISKDSDPKNIDEGKFDGLVEEAMNSDIPYVIDSGSSSFNALSSYIIEEELPQVLNSEGVELIIHIVLRSGAEADSCLQNFKDIVDQQEENVRFIVWLNEDRGKYSIKHDGENMTLFEHPAYIKRKGRIDGIITIPEIPTGLTRDIYDKIVTEEKCTFSDAEKNTALQIMEKRRIAKIKKKIFSPISVVF